MLARPTGLRSYNKKTGRCLFEVILPGTGNRRRVRKIEFVASYPDAVARLHAFREATLSAPTAGAAAAACSADIPTFAGYLDAWWPLLTARLGPGTATHETHFVQGPLRKFFGPFRLDRINSALVQDFAAKLSKEGYAPATRNRILSILRKLLRDGVAREILPAYPLRERLPRAKEVPLQLELSVEERVNFLGAFDDEARFSATVVSEACAGKVVKCARFRAPRNFGGGLTATGAAGYFARFRRAKPLFVVALETGLRRGDLLALRWSAVHLAEGWIELITSKTATPVTIPLTSASRAALLECRQQSAVSEFVFVTDTGRRYSVITVLRYFALAKRLAGISRRFRFHDLRHSFASTWASAGVSLNLIANALGHASSRMAERYARANRQALLQVAQKLNDQNA